METLLICLRAEILKSRRSFAVLLSLAGVAANLTIFFILHAFRQDWASGDGNPWKAYITGHYSGIAFMMLPLFIIILCSLVTFLEHRQDMWVNLFTLPVSRWNIYLSKQLFTLGLFISAHLLFIFGLLFSGILMGIIQPQTRLLQHLPDFGQIALLATQTIWSILGLLALHFWISWRFRALIVPLLIGILGFVTVSLLGPGWAGNSYIPYAYPVQYMPAFEGEITLVYWAGLPAYAWLSPVYFILFTVLAYWKEKK